MASHDHEVPPPTNTQSHVLHEQPEDRYPSAKVTIENGMPIAATGQPEAETHATAEDTSLTGSHFENDLNAKADDTSITELTQPEQREGQPPAINEHLSISDPPLANAPPTTNSQTTHSNSGTLLQQPTSPPLENTITAPPLPKDDSSTDIPDTASTAASTISNPPLEVDSAFDSDADSAITDLHGLGSTQSARSSIYDFVEEHGRTFHRYKEGKYVLPNDATEQDRLDLQHHLLGILLEGRLHLAPIGKNPHSVLDIGTGTGIWAIEFASKYPSAHVIGSDLSPIQPDFVPPNCQFEIDDAEDEWMYSRQFDFIHMRGMMTCFSDPRSVMEKAYNQLEPGGYLEMQDGVFPMHCHDDTLKGTALEEWANACVEAGAKIGRHWTNTPRYKEWMQEIGFENVREKIFEVPTNPWPKGKKAKEVGMWFQADMLDALGATMVLLTKALGWSPERCELFFVDVRKDLRNRGVHAYMPVHVVWGRKPSLKKE